MPAPNHQSRLPDSKSIWSSRSSTQLPDLLRSALTLALLEGHFRQPIYFCSPWITNFPLFDNSLDNFSSLLAGLQEQRQIWFSDVLVALSEENDVRLVTTRTKSSVAFVTSSRLAQARNLQFRFATDDYHEKGILAPSFYIEGSMNITYPGVHLRGEKVIYHTAVNQAGRSIIAGAYLEFNRRWDALKNAT